MDINRLYEEKGKLTTTIEIAQERLQIINSKLAEIIREQSKGVSKAPEKVDKPVEKAPFKPKEDK